MMEWALMKPLMPRYWMPCFVKMVSPALNHGMWFVPSSSSGTTLGRSAAVRCAGGKALNLARAARTLGAEVDLVGIFAGFTGAWLVSQLEGAGIGVTSVDAPGETRTCVSVGSVDTGELTEIYPYAEAVPSEVWDRFCTTLLERLTHRPGWLAISGLTPAGLPRDGLAELIGRARTLGASVAVDTHGPALALAVDARPELTKINRDEAAELLGVGQDTDLREMAESVAARTGAAVVLTDGADGAVGLDDGGVWQVPAHPARGGYPVGSGDSFLGGLLASLDHGDGLVDALRWAGASGTANAAVPGAAVFTADAARRIHDQLAPVRLD